MAQPFPRAWDILKQRPFTHEEVMARNAALPPIGQMGQSPLPPAVAFPSDFSPPMGTYETTQPMSMQQPAMGDETQNRINALQAQIAALQQELQVLVSMQGPQHPQFR